MILVTASLALEFILTTVIISDASTLAAPLGSVLRVYRIHKHASFFGFVLNELFELAEHPHRIPVSIRKLVSNTVEFLKMMPSQPVSIASSTIPFATV